MPDSDRRPLSLIHRTAGSPERVQQLGPYAIESLISRSEEGAGTVYAVRIAPHSTTSISFHGIAEEYYFVISGSGTAVLDGKLHALKAGDFLRLPPGTRHGFVTDEQELYMLDIHTPGCRPDRDTYFEGPPPAGFTGT